MAGTSTTHIARSTTARPSKSVKPPRHGSFGTGTSAEPITTYRTVKSPLHHPPPGGTLADLIKNSDVGLPEFLVRIYTLMILKGINHIHQYGFVHCDINPSNIAVLPSNRGSTIAKYRLKISGFAVKSGGVSNVIDQLSDYATVFYTSHESIALKKCEKPTDIWALGCVVIQMITGQPGLYNDLGYQKNVPEIPEFQLSKDGVDFVRKCLVTDVRERWAEEMLLHHLLHHPFVTKTTATGKVSNCPPLPPVGFLDHGYRTEILDRDIAKVRKTKFGVNLYV